MDRGVRSLWSFPFTDGFEEESPDSVGQDAFRVFGRGPLRDQREWKAPQKTNRPELDAQAKSLE